MNREVKKKSVRRILVEETPAKQLREENENFREDLQQYQDDYGPHLSDEYVPW